MLGSCLLSQPVGKSEDLGGGVEVWFGHFQSLRLGWKPFLNVDATQRAFLKSGKVHEIMADMYGTRLGVELYDRDYSDFHKKIATLKVCDLNFWGIITGMILFLNSRFPITVGSI
jgi:hypothetical protein